MISARRLQPAIALGAGTVIAVVEQEELELGGHHGRHVHRRQALELALQHAAGGVVEQLMVVVEQVADDQRSALEPRDPPHGGDVGLEHEVAIALLPAGHLVAGHRLHVDVAGEQIVAAMRLLMRALAEIAGMEALADQPPLHVRKGRDDGVDGAGLDFLGKRAQAQLSLHGALFRWVRPGRRCSGPGPAARPRLTARPPR